MMLQHATTVVKEQSQAPHRANSYKKGQGHFFSVGHTDTKIHQHTEFGFFQQLHYLSLLISPL